MAPSGRFQGEGRLCPCPSPSRDTSPGIATLAATSPESRWVTFPEYVSLLGFSTLAEGRIYRFSHLQTCLRVIHRFIHRMAPLGVSNGEILQMRPYPQAVAA